MKHKILTTILFFCGALSARIETDHQAFDYCITHEKSFIAIVWPIAQGKDEQIRQTFEKYGAIKYQKSLYFTPDQAYSLLDRAHYNAGIADMRKHVLWYFPPGTFEQPARIFVLKFKNVKTATECKYAIRRIFDLQYRAVHINDTHDETVELAQLFFE
ncbi:MAG: hypothetical protein P4L31_01660 [Candidatus Babeliales bacterium]|nr:hypothetical protein [Candidatus Babeliales bacterium]